MTPNSSNTDAFTQLDELTHKRTALENLIDIAIGIHNQQRAMEDLSLIARPSQEIPAKTVQHLQAFEKKFSELDDDALVQRLHSIEQATHQVIEQVTRVAQLEIHELHDHEAKGLSVDSFKNLVADFERRTQTSLALRFLLKKRGVVLAAFKLPFPQDAIAEQVQALREKEERCVVQIRHDANSIIEDTRALLANPAFTGKMRQQLLSVQQAMEANLTHLDNGGSVLTIPNKFEVIDQQPDLPGDKAPSPSAPAPAPTAAPAEKPAPPPSPKKAQPVDNKPNKTPPRRKLSTFQLLLKWLSTPLSTTWRSLKEENEREER